MRALCWVAADELAVREVPDPEVRNDRDVIVRVRRSATCGGDLPLLAGRDPLLSTGDVLGAEFLGEVVEAGPAIRGHRIGDRVVVGAGVACGGCWYCRQGRHSCCDNAGVDVASADPGWDRPDAGCFGRPRAAGGFAGGHAEYVRVPYADVGAFRVPDAVDDDRALFAADAAPTAWLAAELGEVRPGDVVAVWGSGAVGQLTAHAAVLRGAARVLVVDRHEERLRMAERHAGAEPLDYRRTDVTAELRERSGGRGPDVCVVAVGPPPPRSVVDRLAGGDRPDPVREAVHACRKDGVVVVLGGNDGCGDAFVLGTITDKRLTVRGARRPDLRDVPMLLHRMARDELRTEHLATHRLPLADAPSGYALFAERADGCVRAVFTP
ncbi:alcohol dehydrogenase catalytic domain-containing protein [Micromonospora sp. CA-249363]|uniref:alcohol dehydrogenase catalytic domain-containing protein n=1 Tax=Micromonospora sp. CA-249363 TaxID=3239963 RepID=UPI003D8A32C4